MSRTTAKAFYDPIGGETVGYISSQDAKDAIDETYNDFETGLATKAPLDSPALTGTPTAPTPTVGDNTTKIATTAFVLANAGSGGSGLGAKFVNVQDHGVVPSAISSPVDVLSNLNAAKTAAGQGGTLFFPAHTTSQRYFISGPFEPLRAQTLEGQHTIAYDSDEFIQSTCGIRAMTTTPANFASKGVIIFNPTNNNVDVTIKNLAVEGMGETHATSHDVIFMGAVSNTERNWLIKECNITAGSNRAVGGHQIAMEFRDSFFARCGYGWNPVSGEQLNDVHWIGCKVMWNYHGGIYINSTGGGSGAVTITGGTRIERNGVTPGTSAQSNRDSNAKGILLGNAHNVLIGGCYTDGNANSGLFIDNLNGTNYSISVVGNQFVRDGGGDLAVTDTMNIPGVYLGSTHIQFIGNIVDSGDPDDSVGVAGTGKYPYYGVTLDGCDMCNIVGNRVEISGEAMTRAWHVGAGGAGASYIQNARYQSNSIPGWSTANRPTAPLFNGSHFGYNTTNLELEIYWGGTWRGLGGGAGVTDHGALTGLSDNDHPQYQLTSDKGAASGYASLDAGTKVPIAQVPTGTSSSTVALGDHNHTGTYWKKWTGTQAAYDALGTYDADTLYVTVG